MTMNAAIQSKFLNAAESASLAEKMLTQIKASPSLQTAQLKLPPHG